MTTNTQLILGAILENIEIKGDVETREPRIRSHYSVGISVNGKKVAKSTISKPFSPLLKWEWNANNKILFEASSMMKIVLYRGCRKLHNRPFTRFVGQHEGKVVDLLENDATFDLMGTPILAKMKIVLSPVPTSNDYIKKFMEEVEDDLSRLPKHDAVANTVSMLGQVLKLTKTIMDQVSKAHPILNASWTVVSSIYQILPEQAVQETDLQDDSIRELANTLREMLGMANAIPDLPVIPDTIDVIEAISRQSLQVASLIHEYTKLPWAARTAKIQIPGGLKSRINECRQNFATLKDKYHSRLNFDTNTQVKKTRQMLDAIVDDLQADKIRAWLLSPDSSKNFNSANDKRQAGTCSWFLDGKRFLEWQANPGFLWVKGKAGCGKSFLCSAIIDKLRPKDAAYAIGYFFFDGRDSQGELQLHDKLIRSLILQFSRGKIPTALASLYERCNYHQPSVNQLENALRDILTRFPHAYIVIDALDECTEREMTLNWVNKLVVGTDRKAENLHIVVTSRPEPDIKKVFKGLDSHPIDVGDAEENQDIMKYLKFQMELKSEFNKYDENTQREIELGLEKGAEGSLRWVALMLTELEKCSSPDDITKQLAELPKGLYQIYNRMLERIDDKHRADTRTFLQWLAFSKRPMTVAEIAETITVDFSPEDGPVFNSRKRYGDPQDVLVRCSSLVSESEGTIKLSHFSVKQYLLSIDVEEYFRFSEKTHLKISEISVAYLLQFDSIMPVYAMRDSSPLMRYAAKHWFNHAIAGGMNPTLLKLIVQLFTSETAAFQNWVRSSNIDEQPFFRSPDKAEVHRPLYYASLAGIQEVSCYLLEKGAIVNATGGKYGNALQAASYRGHEVIVKLLLEKEADVNAKGGEYGNALRAASGGGHEVIVKLLLENGADVNAEGGEYGNALQAASGGGHEVIMKLLLENGADVNAEGGKYGNALQAASGGGHEVIVKLLLENGADVNAEGGKSRNALQAASGGGHEVIVKLLLENGADVNAVGGEYGNALQAASGGGHEVIAKLLLENGADVNLNAEGGEYGNALQAASGGGREGIVKLLLENGADVSAEGGEYGNALQAASYRGHEAVVKLLLEKGADVNAKGGGYGNALQAASRGVVMLVHEDRDANAAVVKLLLENGVDVNAEGGKCGNALQAASCGAHEAVVKLLLENEADVNVQGGEYGNALQAASYRGHEVIVKLLLENGADVNAVGGKYGNALQAASCEAHEAVVKLLLEKGADVNAEGGRYENALQAASDKGHEAVVKLLLEKGADVNAKGGVYGNALQLASYRGHEVIVKLLLESGADVNAKGGIFGNAFQIASNRGHEAVVKLLLENGADVNAE